MTTTNWPDLLSALLARQDLEVEQAQWAMEEVMSGRASSAQLAGFLVGLRAKGETASEMTGLAASMLGHSRRIEVGGPAVDVVGTGGDRAHTVNISTMAALAVAATGARVIKHGNRAATSSCGTADVLEELGLDLSLQPEDVAAVGEEVGITFCFAPVHHPSMRHAGPTRRELGIMTAFNFLGPLTNPAQPTAHAIGCADSRMAEVMAEVFAGRGQSALVFRGDDGLDELTTTTTSQVWVVDGGRVTRAVVDPSELGVATAAAGALRGGDREFNAAAVRRLLAGETGAVRDAALLNAAAGLVALELAAGAAGGHESPPGSDLAARLSHAYGVAAAALDSGAAADLLDRWIAAARQRTSNPS